jgi:hypothetical protein
MKLTKDDFPKLRAALIVCAALTAAGAASVSLSMRLENDAKRTRVAARSARDEFDRRLRQVRNEENEIKEKAAIYARIAARGILDEAQRIEWIELVDDIRDKERLIDLKYEIDPQRTLKGAPNGTFSFVASAMKIRVHLLHEEDLTRLIDALRRRASALIEVENCKVSRLPRPDNDNKSTARLVAECRIDWINVLKTDRAEKEARDKK